MFLGSSFDKLTSTWTCSFDGPLVAGPSASQNPFDPHGHFWVLMGESQEAFTASGEGSQGSSVVSLQVRCTYKYPCPGETNI